MNPDNWSYDFECSIYLDKYYNENFFLIPIEQYILKTEQNIRKDLAKDPENKELKDQLKGLGKTPNCSGWGMHDKKGNIDFELIRNWHKRIDPRTKYHVPLLRNESEDWLLRVRGNIGVICGYQSRLPNGLRLMGLDIDVSVNVKDELDYFHSLDTMIVLTPNKHYEVFYRCKEIPEYVKAGSSCPELGIKHPIQIVRWNSGLVLLPPSQRFNPSKRYRMIDDRHVSEIKIKEI